MWSFRSVESLVQDLRFGSRMLVKAPGFTFIAVLTLALGIGANTALFSVVNAVLINPLPYSQSEQLVMIYGDFAGVKANLSVPEYVDFQRQTQGFASSGVFDK